ncbi:hypothetical protein OJAV_G00014000 [Oryzias javanicus]|uniref:Uncharacterized protein n=1 Tax=Oryzias javanicus TaxID=123683 RepID=A0A437DK53_ORYJA|nr:hypothetical protein OJAV_G00014000 [Oryzias javanicus]
MTFPAGILWLQPARDGRTSLLGAQLVLKRRQTTNGPELASELPSVRCLASSFPLLVQENIRGSFAVLSMELSPASAKRWADFLTWKAPSFPSSLPASGSYR